MNNFSSKLNSFYNSHVRLTTTAKKELREKRDRNERRIKNGLKEAKKSQPIKFIKQGSFKHGTLVQPPQNSASDKYDIDEAVVFNEEDCGGPKTTRQWVADAISSQDSNLTVEVLPRCVRVTYANGVQCDFPVMSYREGVLWGRTYELSNGSEWIETDPHHIAKWVDDKVSLSSVDSSGHYQLRKMIRLAKYFAKTQAKAHDRKALSGLAVTSLTIHGYADHLGRDDLAFVNLLKYFSNIDTSASVKADHAVISKPNDQSRLLFLKNQATAALKKFDDGSEENALNFIFQHTFFKKDDKDKKSLLRAGVASLSSQDAGYKPWGE